MEYMLAINKQTGETVRVLRLTKYTEFYEDLDVWYIVPLDKEVRAMTPGDFDMGCWIISQSEAKHENS